MIKCLMIANQFPPMGGSGVQRSVKFVKYLRDFEYEPLVLTRETEGAALKDSSLMQDIPEGVAIIRTKAYDCSEWKGLLRLPGKVLSRKILIPDGEWLWAKKSRKQALQLIQEEKIPLIYTTSYPYSDHLLGLWIKQQLPQVKWVADFRDEWTNNPYTLDNPHFFLRANIEKKQEKAVLDSADALISNTPVMVRNFVENNHLTGNNFYCIPNGYDQDDFAGITKKEDQSGKMTITYVGSLYGRRKPDMFFEAMRQLAQEKSICLEDMNVRFIGNYKKEVLLDTVAQYGLGGSIQILDYMPHRLCLEKLMESDCLLIIEGAGRGAEAFYTGKIFEYMTTNIPVLAILPEKGAAESLVLETKIGVSADPNDIEAIKRNIAGYYKQWKEKQLFIEPDWQKIKQYERKALTGKLADIFNHVLENK